MRITQIAGYLGCGKTTLVLRLSRELADDGKQKAALVVNEIGEIPVEGVDTLKEIILSWGK